MKFILNFVVKLITNIAQYILLEKFQHLLGNLYS